MRITTYCSSSEAVDAAYTEAAHRYGSALGAAGHELVYGGTSVGLMGTVAASTRAAGGRVSGVLPQLMFDRGIADDACDELVVTETMSDRKHEMITRADAFVALPGGFGTLEELLEVLTLKQLGYHRKPIVLLQVDGFWDGLLTFFEELYARAFAKPEYRRLYHLAADVEDLLELVARPPEVDLPTKWY
ncbi:TIGR00730 family Rossman fold protein [Nitriliruptor alkaliphilus]|uniref:LOG family protein n=1 Tax=Nitriliruptor alkaliphilus TaxID=427918 RepID=UPI000698F6F3|nr:TIGR00730 family Rossman fold protein [Nitriliruptor alkaliphilus]